MYHSAIIWDTSLSVKFISSIYTLYISLEAIFYTILIYFCSDCNPSQKVKYRTAGTQKVLDFGEIEVLCFLE